jgi:hypothetical protein
LREESGGVVSGAFRAFAQEATRGELSQSYDSEQWWRTRWEWFQRNRRRLLPGLRADALADRRKLLQRVPGADHHAGEGRLGNLDRKSGLLAQPLVQADQERAPAGKDDAHLHDVGGQLRRGALERLLERLDDLTDRFSDRRAHRGPGEEHGPRQAAGYVPPADLGLRIVAHRRGRADGEPQSPGRASGLGPSFMPLPLNRPGRSVPPGLSHR